MTDFKKALEGRTISKVEHCCDGVKLHLDNGNVLFTGVDGCDCFFFELIEREQ